MLYLVFLVLISISYVKPEKEVVGVEADRIPFLFNTFLGCVDKTGADSTTMQKVMDWKFEDDDLVKKYMYCFGLDAGLTDSDGFIMKDKIMSLFANHKLVGEVGKTVDECNKLKGSDKYETVFKVGVCFKDKSPLWIKI